ncbi:MAG: T9SS type A sorting domain-containing protein [Candidatus Atribacteria bacterium]|nr:T9SS type A sorting domain-containing protein [Candidatus Atribacteria bacterium]
MKTSIKQILLFCFILCDGMVISFAQDSSNYFPLEVGNIWSYKYSDIVEKGLPKKRFISDSVWIQDKIYYKWTYRNENDEGYTELIRQDSIGRIWLRRNEIDKLWMDFTKSDSSKYEFATEHDDTLTVFVIENEIVKTNIGNFSCKVFNFYDPDVFDSDVGYYFAPFVGLVKIRYSHWAQEKISGYSFPNDSVTVNIHNKQDKKKVLDLFAQFKNSPNPFNSNTFIHYYLSSPCNVRIDVLNIHGQIINQLLNQYSSKGDHYVRFDASKLPTGIYFARIVGNNDMRIIRMLHLR